MRSQNILGRTARYSLLNKTIDVPSRKVWPGMDQMISDYATLEKTLKDLRNVLAVIAYQQEDKILTVPVTALEAMPKGCQLEVSFDSAHGNYNFKCVVPPSVDTEGKS